MSGWETPRMASASQRVQVRPIMARLDKEDDVVRRAVVGQQEIENKSVIGLAKPLVAAIHPTPQLEEGSLSPLTVQNTPRIPLAELDPTNLSQRLFHSPGSHQLEEQRLSPHHSITSRARLSPQPSFSTQNLLADNYSSINYSNYASPSQLLHTQPCITSPAQRVDRPQGRDRRYQLNTERQLVELKQQVEQLGTMLCTRQLQNQGSAGIYQLQVEELCREREELLEAVDERERQLVTFKNSLAALNKEYLSDLQGVRGEAQKLTEEVKEREEQRRKLEQQMEEQHDQHRILEREHQKSLKTIQGLQAYITTLPAVEEVWELKGKLEVRNEEVVKLGVQTSEIEAQLMTCNRKLKSSEDKCLGLEVRVKELEERNKEFEGRVNDRERRRYEARGLGEEDVELLLLDKQELERENETLKNLQEWKSRKFGDEKHKLEQQVANCSKLLEQANFQLQGTATELRQTKANNCRLEADIKSQSEEKTNLSAKLDKFAAEISCLRADKAGGSRLDGHYTRLARSMGRCIAELSSLNELVGQVVGGEGDPNVSVLLGVRGVAWDLSDSPLAKDVESIESIEERLELVRAQLTEVGKVQKEVQELRKMIVDKYAENLADNMTSCVTQ